ncbi:MAG TPA: phosphatidate cytidylyltransferase, partial [Crenalkalicoccus sp.]|nr:phosphatidate cytidylyltransferase [Crenalkalicoccus sp.]
MPATAEAAPRPARRWQDFRLRLASAALLVPAALLGIRAGGAAWAALVLAGALVLAWEWARLCGFA